MYNVGFTGTQHGMTKEQNSKLKQMLIELELLYGPLTLHHGDCVGADFQAHSLFHDLTIQRIHKLNKVEIYPSSILTKRAHSDRKYGDINLVIHSTKSPLARNKDIVGASNVLIAAPQGRHEEQRSGTWATIRYARAARLPHYIIYPDGHVNYFG